MAYTLYNTTVLTMFPTKEIKLFDLNIFIVSFCISYFITLIYNYFKKPNIKEYIKNLSDNEMHNLVVELSNKMIIISWTTKKYIAEEIKKMTGKEAERVLGEAHITCNKNGIPNDPEKPMVTSGIRLGSPAMTTRGFKEAEARQVGNFIADVLDNPNDEANIAKVRAQVAELTKRFPVYG